MPLTSASLLQLEHSLYLVDLAAYLVRTERARIMSERQYRRLRRLGKAPLELPVPDLVIKLPDGRRSIFIEFEAHPKTTARYRAILSRYAMSRQPVRFYAMQAGCCRRLQALVDEMGLADLVNVSTWNAAEEVAS
jgi:hypothetical protein